MGDGSTTTDTYGTSREIRDRLVEGDGRLVYLIQCGPYLEIGSSVAPHARFRVVSRSGPPMRLVATVDPNRHGWRSGAVYEAHLHRKFGQLRAEGDWFDFSGPLAAWVRCVVLGAER